MSESILPNHVGFIVDGNRRWAKKHGLPTYEGHLAGYNTVKDIVTETFKTGVKFVSVYSFSTENYKRERDEVRKITGLLMRLLTTDLNIFEKNNIKLVVLGHREKIGKKLTKVIDAAEAKTSNNTAGTLAICFNYGGQLEIVDAIKKIISSGVLAEKVDSHLVDKNIYEPELPPIDLVIRTSGEHRLSNFMLWRIAYSEIIFIDKLWPDMKKEDLKAALREFNKRTRRFGK
jgi:undecaprenyl diphosphate synthase